MSDAASDPGSGKVIQLPRGFRFIVDARSATLSGPGLADDCPYPGSVRDFRLTLPWGPIAVAVTRRDGWEVTAESVRVGPETSLDTGAPLTAYLSSDALAEGATVRTWQPGDRMQPLGMTGTRKLQDVFTDARIPRHWRERIPLVVTPRGIAWIVGSRIADWAAVRPDAAEVAATLIRFDPQAAGADSPDTQGWNDPRAWAWPGGYGCRRVSPRRMTDNLSGFYPAFRVRRNRYCVK